MGMVCCDLDSFLNLIQKITGNTELENRLLTESKLRLKSKAHLVKPQSIKI